MDLPRVFCQIYISLAVVLLGFFINHSSVYPFSSIVCKHVEGGFHPSFSISCFSHGIKLTFVRGTITDDYWRQYYVNVRQLLRDLESYFLLYVCGVSPLYWNIEKKRILKTEDLKRGTGRINVNITQIFDLLSLLNRYLPVQSQ